MQAGSPGVRVGPKVEPKILKLDAKSAYAVLDQQNLYQCELHQKRD